MSWRLLWLLRSGFKSVRVRRLESAAVVLMVCIPVAFMLAISLASDYALKLAGWAWAYEIGNIVASVDGIHDVSGVVSKLGVPVKRVKVLYLVTTIASRGEDLYSVLLVYNPNPDPPYSYTPPVTPSDSRVYMYMPGTRVGVNVGSKLLIAGINVTVAGKVKGIATISSADIVLLAPRQLVEAAARKGANALTILAIVAEPGVNLSRIADQVRGALEASGLKVENVFTMSLEQNPTRAPLESVAHALNLLSTAGFAAALVVLAAISLIAAERGVREAGTLEALGASRSELVAFFSARSIVLGVTGVLLGLMMSIPLSYLLIAMGARGSVVELLMKELPYSPDILSMTTRILVLLILSILAPTLPVAFYLRGETWEKLRLGSLAPKPYLRIVSRRLFEPLIPLKCLLSSPWKLLVLVLLTAILWGSTASTLAVYGGFNSKIAVIASADFDALIIAPVGVQKLVEALSSAHVKAIDLYKASWHGSRIYGLDVVVYLRLNGSLPYLYYPILKGRPPIRPGEVLVTPRLAHEYSLSIGSKFSLTGECNATVTVVGIAEIPVNNGAAVVVGPNTCTVAGDTLAVVKLDGVNIGELRRVLLLSGIPPAIVESKESIVDSYADARSALKFMLTVASTGIVIASILGIAFTLVADAASRLREVALFRALGYTDKRIALLHSLQAVYSWIAALPVALVAAKIYAGELSSKLAGAFGYIEPSSIPLAALESTPVLLGSLLVSVLALMVFLRRTETLELITREM